METNQPNLQEYGPQHIKLLKGLEAVRKRPAMYVGDAGSRGLHHLVREVFDNCVDEAMNGHCDLIKVRLHADGRTISITDNGRGIPVGPHPTEGISTLQVVLTNLHAGGKFEEGAFKAAGGLHGVGIKCVNALSDKFTVTVARTMESEKGIYTQSYEKGLPLADVVRKGDLREKRGGTDITFSADPEIFTQGTEFDTNIILPWFEETAFLNAGLEIRFKDDRHPANPVQVFQSEKGIVEFVERMSASADQKFPLPPINFEKEVDGIWVECALHWTDAEGTQIYGFANNIRTHDGGTHVNGFTNAIPRVLNKAGKICGVLKEKDSSITKADALDGVIAVVNVRVVQPSFQGQTKDRLMTAEAEPAVATLTNEALTEYFEKNPAVCKQVVARAMLAQQIRAAKNKASDSIKRQSFLGKVGRLPGKLYDCETEDNRISELFIVEGDSAAGCLSATTLLKLTDGRNLSFKDIVAEQANGKTHFIYTLLPDGNIGIEEAINARVTKHKASLVKVTLDNGCYEICTPDHLFLLRDGTYCRADNMKNETSLMPLRTCISDAKNNPHKLVGYEMVWQPQSHEWHMTHRLADNWNISNCSYDVTGHFRHHIDFNKLNNDPTNIIRMTRNEHLRVHYEAMDRGIHRPDVQAKSVATRRLSEFREKQSVTMKNSEKAKAILAARNIEQWNDPAYREYMVDCWKKFCELNPDYVKANKDRLCAAQAEYWSSEENRREQSERTRSYFESNPEAKEKARVNSIEQWDDPELRVWRAQETSKLDQARYNRVASEIKDYIAKNEAAPLRKDSRPIPSSEGALYQRYIRFCHKYFNGDDALALEAVQNHNHRVVSVEHLDYTEDVYDLEVPNTHNFALASGVFVHNSAKQGREASFQAVLPIRGKIINSEKHEAEKLFANKEVQALIAAIGTGVGDNFELENRRYDKIVILSDADVDGLHIRSLLLACFERLMPGLIRAGHVYVAMPPLYRVNSGKKVVYCFDEAELEKIRSKMSGKIEVTRFKGLGEMDWEELGETTMKVGPRKIIQVCMDDAEAGARMLATLMGANVAARKDHIILRSTIMAGCSTQPTVN